MRCATKEAVISTSRRKFLVHISAAAAFTAAKPLASFGAVGSWPGAEGAMGAGSAEWSRKQSPLMTRWSASVDPKNPLPDYPRPQFVRKEWMNLNGIWEYQPGKEKDKAPVGQTLASSICVPFGVESALSGVMELHDRIWYRRMVTIPADWKGKDVLLHFGAVDWESEVFVNGQSVGVHQGGYDPFTHNITAQLKPGENELIVRVFDPTEHGGQPRGKQVTEPRGIMYTPTTGIWQTVWLEPVTPSFIEDMLLNPDVDKAQLGLTVNVAKAASDMMVEVKVKDGGKTVAKVTVAPNALTNIAIPQPKLWSPDSPFLYDLEFELKQGATTVDKMASYFAMRKHSIGKGPDGEIKLMLNNQPIFEKGPLDQGFWPDGIYTAPTEEAMKSDVEAMKAMGFNYVRKHIKVEPARWYHWCDKLGLMVWQDMPSCNSYVGKFVPPPVDTAAFKRELTRLVLTKRNTPSIIQWVTFNEGQGQKAFDTGEIVNMVRKLDPTPRTINEASGGDIHGFGDLNDVHSYPEPAVRPSNGKQALVCGEFGGIGYFVPRHSWEQSGKSYVMVQNADDLYYLYAEFMEQIYALKQTKNLSGYVYTELTDVMTEINGLLCYDRTPKLPFDKIKEINDWKFPRPSYKDLVATSEQTPQAWKLTTEHPSGGPEAWQATAYDDSKWKDAKGSFGSHGEHVGTKWTSGDLWLRKHFNPGMLTPAALERTVLTLCREGASEIYINGLEANVQHGNNRSFNSHYEHRPLMADVRKALVINGDNVIAVHCKGSGDAGRKGSDNTGLFFDLGLAVRSV
jgi:hypothetical protein